jgi:hypothetical protein
MAAFWAVFTFGGSGPALTAHGSLDLKQEIQIQIVFVCFRVMPLFIGCFFYSQLVQGSDTSVCP